MITDRERDISDLIGGDEPVDIPATVNAKELSTLIGVGARQISFLVDQGIVIRAGRGRYDTRASIVNVIASLRKRSSHDLDAEKVRLTREQADKIEIANQKARGELIPAAEVERTWAGVLRDVRAAVLALPSRLQQRLPHLTAHDVTTVDREVRAALSEMANAD